MSDFMDRLLLKGIRKHAIAHSKPHYNWLLDRPEVVDALSQRKRLTADETAALYRYLREQRRYELATLCLYTLLPAYPEYDPSELIPKPAQEGDEQEVLQAWTGFVTALYRHLSTDGLCTMLWIADHHKTARCFFKREMLTDREAGNLCFETLEAKLYQLTALALCVIDGQKWR